MGKPTVSANGLSVVHAGSKGKLMSTVPDVCQIPGPNGPIPIPFMNKAESKDLSGGTVTVKIEGNPVAVMGSTISKSSGDAGGILGGIVSGGTEGKALTFMFSPDVIMEMRPVIRKTDKAIMNDINTICLSGWDQPDISGAENKEWVKFKVIEDDGSENPINGVKDVKLKITLPSGTKEVVSGPGGVISFVDIDPGNCSVELNEEQGSDIIEITDRWPVSGLATRQKHKIAVKIKDYSPFSG
ncbi:MAG: DUF4150 domain-containing protein [Proteobacteria bacterium]|nr:DUF4150 domain-containing protein [Pseudomonadota bacterium]